MITKNRYSSVETFYHRSRPHPPEILKNLVNSLLGKKEMEAVVDIGCGTGISTTFWSDFSKQVVGIDISEEMIAFAKEQALIEEISNVSFFVSDATNTGLANQLADLVYVSQAIHWMEPEQTTEEVFRVLKSKGIYLALNCNLIPLFDTAIENEYSKLWQNINSIRKKLDVKNESLKWTMDQHFEAVRKSGATNYIRKVKFCSEEQGSIRRLIDLTHSIGMTNVLHQQGVSKEEMGIIAFEHQFSDRLEQDIDWYFFFEGFIAQK